MRCASRFCALSAMIPSLLCKYKPPDGMFSRLLCSIILFFFFFYVHSKSNLFIPRRSGGDEFRSLAHQQWMSMGEVSNFKGALLLHGTIFFHTFYFTLNGVVEVGASDRYLLPSMSISSLSLYWDEKGRP